MSHTRTQKRKSASHFSLRLSRARAEAHTRTRIGLRCAAQYDPNTGAQLAAVALPVKRPTACTFGARTLSLACVRCASSSGCV
jgi:hypothetical protein